MKRSTRIAAIVAAGLALSLTLSACGKDKAKTSTSGGSITIGSADFPESQLLAEIYAQALQAKGVTVAKKLNIGERAAYITALTDGSIDLIPEYNGSILYFLDTKATAKSTTDVDSALKAAAAAKGWSILNSAAAQDSDTITVTKKTVDKYSLHSIGDLAKVAGTLTLGAPAGFKTRADGVPSLASVYGVTFGHFTPTSAGGAVTVTALKNGSIDAADIFSTDAAIAANGFVSLADTKNKFAAQNIVPLITTSKLNATITAACNAVSAKLDTATLAGLVAKVQNDKLDAASVAKDWIASVGLI